MNKLGRGLLVLVIGLTGSATAHADGAFSGKVGVLLGPYSYSSEFTDQGCNCITAADTYEETDFDLGLNAGLTLGVSRWFADVGVEFIGFAEGDDLDDPPDGEEDPTFRTDSALTTGVYLGDRWVLFGGYRNTHYGDGFASDTGGFIQQGPFIGGGATFKMGSRTALGVSLAYNDLTMEIQGTTIDDLDLAGFSGKLQLNILKSPNSIYLRWQHFSGSIDFPALGYGFEFTEDYVNLGYQLTFDFTSW